MSPIAQARFYKALVDTSCHPLLDDKVREAEMDVERAKNELKAAELNLATQRGLRTLARPTQSERRFIASTVVGIKSRFFLDENSYKFQEYISNDQSHLVVKQL